MGTPSTVFQVPASAVGSASPCLVVQPCPSADPHEQVNDATRDDVQSTASGYIDIAPDQPTSDIKFTIDVSYWNPGFYKVGCRERQVEARQRGASSKFSVSCLPPGQLEAARMPKAGRHAC